MSAKYHKAAWFNRRNVKTIPSWPSFQSESQGHMHKCLYVRCTACNITNYGLWPRWIVQCRMCNTATGSVLHSNKRNGGKKELEAVLVTQMGQGPLALVRELAGNQCHLWALDEAEGESAYIGKEARSWQHGNVTFQFFLSPLTIMNQFEIPCSEPFPN